MEGWKSVGGRCCGCLEQGSMLAGKEEMLAGKEEDGRVLSRAAMRGAQARAGRLQSRPQPPRRTPSHGRPARAGGSRTQPGVWGGGEKVRKLQKRHAHPEAAGRKERACDDDVDVCVCVCSSSAGMGGGRFTVMTDESGSEASSCPRASPSPPSPGQRVATGSARRRRRAPLGNDCGPGSVWHTGQPPVVSEETTPAVRQLASFV